MRSATLYKSDERAVFSLRSLYKQYGYMPYKMSKFEEYDLYVSNKDFLVSDKVITFNDTNGKLMALKPDVTLSIIKNAEDSTKTKVYYNENVYRVSESTHQYKEIMQAGLECIGDIDSYDIFESVMLAAKSLECISESYVLDISHLDILTALLDDACDDEKFRAEIVCCIKEKNSHDIQRICQKFGVSDEKCSSLCALCGIYEKIGDALPKLSAICKSDSAKKALGELYELYELFKSSPYADRLYIDFSIVNDMNYYNGIVFKGFIDGIFTGVLAGGRYDKLLSRMGRRSSGIGFALYLDLLEGYCEAAAEYDVDVLLLYSSGITTKEIADQCAKLIAQGKSVSAQKSIPQKLRYKELIKLGEEVGK